LRDADLGDRTWRDWLSDAACAVIVTAAAVAVAEVATVLLLDMDRLQWLGVAP
jgi:hypothetical protein